ncbi:putative 2-oxoglutarate dehydrogenase E1 component DHKTD1, mitochondrial [Phlyctochytrium bullatum]|nr:putative 2-oxoglutarate dehydrogenase E1 component DHKTD1, mitochondrial [Phlyctochytrium bullatum]
MPNLTERRFMNKYVESHSRGTYPAEQLKRMMSLLTKSEVFDHFMAKRFPQVKRYGLEGAEGMMVALDSLFAEASAGGIHDVILGMPHRGRLNLLTDLLQFNPTALFHKVKGNSEFPANIPGTGDVLSHVATSVDLNYANTGRPIHVSLLHNPSHLEAVNPVAVGKARARQMYLYESGENIDNCFIGDRVMCVQLHGDSAFTGQGVVMETLGLSNLPHFTAGGSVHIIVNNQIGYTTPAMNARSTVYTSDIGKMINAPVIHVNADYPEDVSYAVQVALAYRQRFRKDVIIDLIAYRRMGHNELDEPSFTQPLMYKTIRSRRTVPVLFEERLKKDGVVTQEEIDTLRKSYFEKLDKHLEESYTYQPVADTMKGKWSKMVLPTEAVVKLDTGVKLETLKEVGVKSVDNHGIKYHVQSRKDKVTTGTGLDWATCETLAFGTLLLEGYPVRISGQDVGRGTFSQRHVMLVDQDDERTIIPLNRMQQGQKFLEIANSSLSEFAVMGFELGVSWEHPNRLCIWEAQFGDFFNGAQIIIDTYLASGEAKWLRQSGLVLLLPHGYDGAGPEHSSCRVERFLQLCDTKFDYNDPTPDNPNMHVVNPTTPAQYFHLLRRQMLRNYRKPLIVVGPKTLLRHPQAVSSLSEMAPGTSFQPVLSSPASAAADSVKKVIFLSGKICYDIEKERASRGLENSVAIVRLEEIAPFPWDDLKATISQYKNAEEFIWLQEEPQNQGCFTFVAPRLEQLLPLGAQLKYVGRQTLAAPATGIATVYKKEQAGILSGAFIAPRCRNLAFLADGRPWFSIPFFGQKRKPAAPPVALAPARTHKDTKQFRSPGSVTNLRSSSAEPLRTNGGFQQAGTSLKKTGKSVITPSADDESKRPSDLVVKVEPVQKEEVIAAEEGNVKSDKGPSDVALLSDESKDSAPAGGIESAIPLAESALPSVTDETHQQAPPSVTDGADTSPIPPLQVDTGALPKTGSKSNRASMRPQATSISLLSSPMSDADARHASNASVIIEDPAVRLFTKMVKLIEAEASGDFTDETLALHHALIEGAEHSTQGTVKSISVRDALVQNEVTRRSEAAEIVAVENVEPSPKVDNTVERICSALDSADDKETLSRTIDLLLNEQPRERIDVPARYLSAATSLNHSRLLSLMLHNGFSVSKDALMSALATAANDGAAEALNVLIPRINVAGDTSSGLKKSYINTEPIEIQELVMLLWLAFHEKHISVVRLLFNFLPPKASQDAIGMEHVAYACIRGECELLDWALLKRRKGCAGDLDAIAAIAEHPDIVSALSKKSKSNPNLNAVEASALSKLSVSDWLSIALVIATALSHRDCIRSLLQSGASPKWRKGYPLAIAQREGHVDIIEQLMRSSQEQSSFVWPRKKSGSFSDGNNTKWIDKWLSASKHRRSRTETESTTVSRRDESNQVADSTPKISLVDKASKQSLADTPAAVTTEALGEELTSSISQVQVMATDIPQISSEAKIATEPKEGGPQISSEGKSATVSKDRVSMTDDKKQETAEDLIPTKRADSEATPAPLDIPGSVTNSSNHEIVYSVAEPKDLPKAEVPQEKVTSQSNLAWAVSKLLAAGSTTKSSLSRFLGRCAESGDATATAAFLNAGADPNTSMSFPATLEFYGGSLHNSDATCLAVAAACGHEAVVIALLEAGADASLSESLALRASAGCTLSTDSILARLLIGGADPAALAHEAIRRAALRGSPGALRVLVAVIAGTVKAKWEVRSVIRVAYESAAKAGHAEAVAELLKEKATWLWGPGLEGPGSVLKAAVMAAITNKRVNVLREFAKSDAWNDLITGDEGKALIEAALQHLPFDEDEDESGTQPRAKVWAKSLTSSRTSLEMRHSQTQNNGDLTQLEPKMVALSVLTPHADDSYDSTNAQAVLVSELIEAMLAGAAKANRARYPTAFYGGTESATARTRIDPWELLTTSERLPKLRRLLFLEAVKNGHEAVVDAVLAILQPDVKCIWKASVSLPIGDADGTHFQVAGPKPLGQMALYLAAANGSAKVVARLISAGVDVEADDARAMTIAEERDQKEVVNYLAVARELNKKTLEKTKKRALEKARKENRIEPPL